MFKKIKQLPRLINPPVSIQPVFSARSNMDRNPEYMKLLKIKDIHHVTSTKIAVIDTEVGKNNSLNFLLKIVEIVKEPHGADLHGSHVASIIADNKYGWTDRAPIINFKALSTKTGTGSFRDIAKAVNTAKKMGCEILNLSIGAPHTSYVLERAISLFLQEPTNFVVVAAGNSGASTDFPARLAKKYKNLISVGSGNIISKDKAALSHFSNTGVVTLIAQGEDVLGRSQENKEIFLSGTSMAAPLVSACIAIAKEIVPEFNFEDFHSICGTEGVTIDVDSRGFDINTGYGYLLPYMFIERAQEMAGGGVARVAAIKSKPSLFVRFLAFIFWWR